MKILLIAAALACAVAGNAARASAALSSQCVGPQVKLFDNWNHKAVQNGGAPPSFGTNGRSYCVTAITTYHWNGGKGKAAGTIGLKAVNGLLGGGTSLGPWRATGSLDWKASPPAALRPVVINGTYTCVDSSRATWAHNHASGGAGFCAVYGTRAAVKTVSVSAADAAAYLRQVAAEAPADGDVLFRNAQQAGLVPSPGSPVSLLVDDSPQPGPSPEPDYPDPGEYSPDNPEDVPDPYVPDATELRIVVKSYIATIGAAIGPFAPILELARAKAFAALTDAAWSENPLTDVQKKDYRLFTRTTALVVCNGANMMFWRFSKLRTDTGTEPPKGGIQAPRGFLRGAKFARVNASTVSFQWRFYGRPNALAEVGIQRVKARTSVFIWHDINGTITCIAGQQPKVVATLIGSSFPTHRWYLNGAIQATIPQGVLFGLWVPVVPNSNVVK